MLAILIALFVIYAWWAPGSWLGRLLADASETLGRRFQQIRPATLLIFVGVVAGLAALVVYGETEGVLITAMAGPQMLAWFATIDVGLAVELAVTAWLLTARSGFKAAMPLLRARGHRIHRAYRRKHRARRRKLPAARADNDDERPATPQRALLAA